MLALESAVRLVAENGKTASGRPRRNVATGETKMSVSGKNRVGQRVRFVIFRVNRIDRVNHRVIGREWRGDNFICADECPGQAAIETVNEAGRVGDVGPVEQSRLFHGSANFSTAGKFCDVVDAATELVFRPGATGDDQRDSGKQRRNVERAHKYF